MIEMRRFTLDEVEPMTALAMEALALSDGIPLHKSVHKVRALIRFFAESAVHFQLAAFVGAAPVAALIMFVCEMPMHERAEGCVMMCYSKVPGAGAPLIRSMMAFVADDIRIQRVQWQMNEHPDPRFTRMLKRRFGFTRPVENLVFYKGA